MIQKTPVLFCFFACAKGGRRDKYGLHRFLDSNKYIEDWTKAMHDKYGDAEITLFDTNEWDAPQLNVASLEGDLPSVSVDIAVTDAVKKALLARGVQPQIIETCLKSDNRSRSYSTLSGMVTFEFKCP